MINRIKSEVTIESCSTKSEQTPKHHAEKQYAPSLRILSHTIVCAFVIMLPPFMLVSMNMNADVQLFCGRSHRTFLLAEDYYYHGWPVESLKNEAQKENMSCGLFSYMTDADGHHQRNLKSRLDYSIDREKAAAQDRLITSSTQASRFYVKGIEQPTEKLEQFYLKARGALEAENFDDLTEALSNIENEQLQLSQAQTVKVETQIEWVTKSIRDIVFLSSVYAVENSEINEEVTKILNSTSSGYSKLAKLQHIRTGIQEDLDSTIISRGGNATEGKRILILISNQRLYMIEDYYITYDMPVSTGIYGHQTGLGEFQVYEKVSMAWGYYHIWMPYWLTIYYAGDLENGIHGIPISPSTGRWDRWDTAVGNYPITYGCVMPHDWDAKTLYDWAEVGIPVSILP